MTSINDLIVGNLYFLMSFYDSEFRVPKIRTVIYIGKNIHRPEEAENEWYFQDAGSYLEYGSFVDLPKETKRDVFVLDEDSLSFVYNLDELIKDLIEVREGRLGKFKP